VGRNLDPRPAAETTYCGIQELRPTGKEYTEKDHSEGNRMARFESSCNAIKSRQLSANETGIFGAAEVPAIWLQGVRRYLQEGTIAATFGLSLVREKMSGCAGFSMIDLQDQSGSRGAWIRIERGNALGGTGAWRPKRPRLHR
jgi:hypothetical protein